MSDMYVDDTGHTVLRGSRWHFPVTGDPTRCGVPGCERVLGEARRRAELEAAIFDAEDGDEHESPADPSAEDPAPGATDAA